MKDNRKWPGLTTLPGIGIPGSPPDSPQESEDAPPHVVNVPQPQDSPLADPQLPLKFEAGQSRRSVSFTEQHEQISVKFERGPAVTFATPPKPASSSAAPTQPPSARPAHAEPPPSVTPIHDDLPPQDVEPQANVGPDHSFARAVSLIGCAVVVGIVLIVSLIILQKPISDLAKAHEHAQKANLVEVQRQADYAALEAYVLGGIREIQQTLADLDAQAQALAADAEIELGQPLQQIRSNPRVRPRELDLAILESRETAANWASLLNATSNPPESKSISVIMADLESKAREGKLVPNDHKVVAGLLTRTAQQQAQAGERTAQVQRLTRSLEARRLETALEAAERNQVPHVVDHPSH